ncbi:MAG: hypothetical protein WBR10_18245 [Candidatus Acidiferrum sp.]
MLKRFRLLAGVSLLFGFLLFIGLPKSIVRSDTDPAIFSLGPSGDYLEAGDKLVVATRLNNTSEKDAFRVEIDSIRLESAELLSPKAFPLAVGEIEPEKNVTVQADFNSSHLEQGKPYRLVVHGTYRPKRKEPDHDDDKQGNDERREFTVSDDITLPRVSPGSAQVKSSKIEPQTVTGGHYPHREPNFEEKENGSRWTVPTGPFVAGKPTPTGTATQKAPRTPGDPPGVTFNANDGLGINGSTIAEPSGAVGGGVVFVTANFYAAYSKDGGATFTKLDPTTIFPNDNVGLCCDQIVQYVPSIDRFIWLLQGTDASAVQQPNGQRIASASPAQIISSSGTSWTYWDLTPGVFGEPIGTGFDYPDLSVGTNYLYMSWDVGWPGCPKGCSNGHLVARSPLSQIKAGGTIGLDYTTPSDSSSAWGAHLTQDTGNEIFWVGQQNNSSQSLRVFSLAEGSNTYFWRDIGTSSWANNALSSLTPDGQNWVNKLSGFPGNAVTGATRSSNDLWFAWSAGTDNNFQQPHVEMVTLDRSNNFNLIRQVQIWNNNYAFAYPALATNACTGEVGLSLEYGGNNKFYENHVVGFWGDFLVYVTTDSSVGTTRFGDYVSIRQDSTPSLKGAFFDAFGFGLDKTTSGTKTDTRYVVFGRSGPCKRGR